MALPSINSYSQQEINWAKATSPAISHYLQLLEKKPNCPEDQTRLIRHNYWVQCALATLLKTAPAHEVCLFWSEKSDELLKKAWEDSGALDHSIALFALGKLGAKELNLSSDVDLLYVSEKPAGKEELASLRHFTKSMGSTDAFGFCYRIDTDLRPGGRFGPVISSLNQFGDYYWQHGATWERLALVRLRPICGPQALVEQTLEKASQFVYRKYIDYTLFEDLKQLRTMIQDHRQEESEGRLHLKLHPGGIRDTELFINALQVIHGGKLRDIRAFSINDGIENLIKANAFEPAILKKLKDHYWYLRQLENTSQSLEDQQTHIWKFNRKIKLKDNPGDSELLSQLNETNQIVSQLLGTVSELKDQLPSTEKDQTSWLKQLGFNDKSIQETWPQIIIKTAQSTQSQRDEIARRKFLYLFITDLAELNKDKDLALSLLFDFIKNTRAKASFFTLLLREHALRRDLAQLFSSSPYLGGIISSRPELLDSYIFKYQEQFSSNFEQLLEELIEKRLVSEIISANRFLNTLDIERLGDDLTTTANEISKTLLEKLKTEYGQSEVDILCLGKWGGRELGFRSDLDFVFILHNSAKEIDHKIAKRFISRITENHRGGSMYSADLRLRPSGQAGPLLVTIDQLEEYLKTKAAAWERQSYLRARSLNNASLDVAAWCVQKPLTDDDLSELKDIRRKLLKSPVEGKIDLKYSAGGLIDMEFATQITFLYQQKTPPSGSTIEMISALNKSLPNWQTCGEKLLESYSFLRRVEQLYQLVSNHSGSSMPIESSEFLRLSQSLNATPKDLLEEIKSHFAQSLQCLKDLDPL